MIPYVPTPAFEIGDTRIDAWLILVVAGILIGIEYCRKRAIREALSVKVAVDAALVAVAAGFLVGHVVHVLAYSYDVFQDDWQVILPWYGGYSSTGGFLGAAIGLPIYFRLKKVPAWAYADTLALGFVLAWIFGRSGCFLAHDHIGRRTDFFLAVDFPGGPRHDLGLYEALLALVIFLVFFVLDRKRQWFHGFFTGVLLVAYAPIRFGFEFLRGEDLEAIGRRSDARYLGLTPAQYGAIGLLLLGLWILWRRSRAGRQDTRREILRDFPKGLPAELARQLESEESSEATSHTQKPDDGSAEPATPTEASDDDADVSEADSDAAEPAADEEGRAVDPPGAATQPSDTTSDGDAETSAGDAPGDPRSE